MYPRGPACSDAAGEDHPKHGGRAKLHDLLKDLLQGTVEAQAICMGLGIDKCIPSGREDFVGKTRLLMPHKSDNEASEYRGQ